MFDFYSTFLAAVCIVGSIGLALSFYALGRRFLVNRIDEHSKDMASSIIFRVSALHGLILALVFAQELLNYNKVRTVVAQEAIAVGDVFFDLGRLDPDATLEIRKSLANYAHIVVHEEWERLGNGEGLSPAAWRHWEAAYQGALDLEVKGHRNETLSAHVVSTIRKISGYRRARENAADFGLNPLFWTVAFFGIMFISVPYLTFPPTFMNITMLSIFGAYTGLVIFVIAAAANPYNAPAKLQPIGMTHLLKSEMGNFHTGKSP